MNEHILHVEGTFTRYNLNCMVSFIYAPIDGILKKELWDYLIPSKIVLAPHGALQVILMKLCHPRIEKVVQKFLLL
jgi:hypothetical protein